MNHHLFPEITSFSKQVWSLLIRRRPSLYFRHPDCRCRSHDYTRLVGKMSLFRSEPVLRYQLILQSEAAYQCVAELGEIDAVQFLDSNPDMSTFQRKYVAEVKRCEELERILRYINHEAKKEDIVPFEPVEEPRCPNPRAITDLEAELQTSERTVRIY